VFYVAIHTLGDFGPEPIMLKNLPIIPYHISQIFIHEFISISFTIPYHFLNFLLCHDNESKPMQAAT